MSPKRAAADVVLAEARRERERMAGGQCEANTPACPQRSHRGWHAHHVTRRSQGGGHTVDNLRWVCFDGHDWIHRNPADARQRALLA